MIKNNIDESFVMKANLVVYYFIKVALIMVLVLLIQNIQKTFYGLFYGYVLNLIIIYLVVALIFMPFRFYSLIFKFIFR